MWSEQHARYFVVHTADYTLLWFSGVAGIERVAVSFPRSLANLPPAVLRAYASQNTDVILPDYNEFTGFVFKLQANLDPRHRDRLAYVRVVSGRYEKGMKVRHRMPDVSSAVRSVMKNINSNVGAGRISTRHKRSCQERAR